MHLDLEYRSLKEHQSQLKKEHTHLQSGITLKKINSGENMSHIKKFLREPLTHFLVIGAILFILFNLVNGPIDNNNTSTIIITQEKIDQLSKTFYDTWLREPTPEQLDNIIEQYIQDEVYYREGLALGLDKGDKMINTRIRQKVEYIVKGTANIPTPTENELSLFLEENKDKYSEGSLISFNQIYLLNTEDKDVLSQLQSGKDPKELGDSFLLPYSFEQVYQSEIKKQFGEEFAEDIFEIRTDEWNPVRSGLANHLVYVEEIQKGRTLTLEEARFAVERDWNSEEQKKLVEENYKTLLNKYKVIR